MVEQTAEPATARAFEWVHLGLLGTLGLLLWHAIHYAFLTDDAFISFRYARNLSEGYGLVFNPGFERVEGYTNFLWVVILAGFNAIGLAPESVSHVLTLGATLALWGVVVWFVMRDSPERGKRWLVLIAPLFLACTRSVAVWSTSGLETRIFEALMVSGVLRLLAEIEGLLKGQRRQSWSGLLFALGTLTRPDMLLVSGMAMGVAWLTLLGRRKLDLRWAAGQAGAFGMLVGGHYLFRFWYYGEWLPNTYYAKVGGRTWWDMGGIYLGMFALEYAVYLWVPMLIGAVLAHRARRRLYVSAMFTAVIVPHAAYVASVGGDHFEYRPLDLYFPFVFLMIYDGARHFARGRTATILTVGWLTVILVGLTAMPCQTPSGFPNRHFGGFPGRASWREGADRYLLPEENPIYRWPGLRSIAGRYRELFFQATAQLVGIRQEEHKIFFENVSAEGKRLAQLIESGQLPKDLHIAIGCVGAVPYYSNLRTLDRAGLTEAHVSRFGLETEKRMMAHDKNASFEYAAAEGVEFWSLDPIGPLRHVGRTGLVGRVLDANRAGLPVYAADAGDGFYVVGLLPQGIGPLGSDANRLTFRPIRDPTILKKMLREMVSVFEDAVAWNEADDGARMELARGLYHLEDFASAAEQYEAVGSRWTGQFGIWQNLMKCYERMGDFSRAAESTRRALALARDKGDQALISRLTDQLKRYVGENEGSSR